MTFCIGFTDKRNKVTGWGRLYGSNGYTHGIYDDKKCFPNEQFLTL